MEQINDGVPNVIDVLDCFKETENAINYWYPLMECFEYDSFESNNEPCDQCGEAILCNDLFEALL